MNELTPANCKTLGTGSEKSVCLFAIVNGIGDAVHMLPALSQMLSDGYELTVYCRAFHVPIYEAINVQHVIACESESEIGISWAAENEHLFGSWYSLHSWGGWYCDSHGHHDTGTMQEFADIVGTTLPESFSWIDTLKPERGLTDGKYILFAPDSAESWRSLSLEQANEFYTALQKQGNVVWLAQPPACVSEAFIREYVNEILRISTPEDAQRELDAFRNREHARITAAMKNKFIARSWKEFLDVIYNADRIVTVESGVANLAGALGKQPIVLCGLTDVEHTIGQFEKYLPTDYTVVQGKAGDCTMPCYRHPANGFVNGKCQGKFNEPQCLRSIETEQVLTSFQIEV